MNLSWLLDKLKVQLIVFLIGSLQHMVSEGKEILFAKIFLLIKIKNFQKLNLKCVIRKGHDVNKI
jgi:hypothetical protein